MPTTALPTLADMGGFLGVNLRLSGSVSAVKMAEKRRSATIAILDVHVCAERVCQIVAQSEEAAYNLLQSTLLKYCPVHGQRGQKLHDNFEDVMADVISFSPILLCTSCSQASARELECKELKL